MLPMVERQTVTIKKSEVTPSEASKSFFESKFKNLKWKKGGDEDYPSVVAHKKFRGVPIDIEIDEDGDRKSTRLNSSHDRQSRMPSSA